MKNSLKTIVIVSFLMIFFSNASAQSVWNTFLLDNWHPDTLIAPPSGMVYNGVWGFVQDNQEYAVMGSTEGTHFFKIQDNNELLPVDFVPGKFSSEQVIHRDYKDYNGYLYAVCGEGNSSLQIIDLQYLPDSVSVIVDNDSIMGRVNSIFIDTSSALLYACTFTPIIDNPFDTIVSMVVFSLTNPLSPNKIYNGPNDINQVCSAYGVNDTIFLNCGADGLRIYDFSNPTTPNWIGALTTYQDQGFNHAGYLSPDKKTYYFSDETEGKRLKKVDITDVGNPIVTSLFGTNYTDSSASCSVIANDKLIFVAYHNEGFRVYDTRYTPPKEIAYYDTYIAQDTNKFNGACGIYTDLPSKRVLISDRTNGLFLFEFDAIVFENNPPKSNFAFYKNPSMSGDDVTFRFNEDGITSIEFELYDKSGKIIENEKLPDQSYWIFHNDLSSGTYPFVVKYLDANKEESYHYGQLVVVGNNK